MGLGLERARGTLYSPRIKATWPSPGQAEGAHTIGVRRGAHVRAGEDDCEGEEADKWGHARKEMENGSNAGCPRGKKEKWAEEEALGPSQPGVFLFNKTVIP